jgi:TolB-like protein/DNA-binding winged helix-turn-helix (wHTH) protein
VTTQPIGVQSSIRLGEDFELNLCPRRLRRGAHVLKLERIPLEILVLLLEHKNEIVTREQIVSRVWGEGAFLDADNSIRGAIRKLRQALKDDAEAPQFIQTVTGQGYRFIAPVTTGKKQDGAEAVEQPAAVGTSAQEFLSELDHWFEARRLRVVEEDRSQAGDSRAESTPVEANRTSRRWIFAAAMSLFMAACLLSAVAIWRWQQKSILAPGPPHRIVLAVLPFENLSVDPDQEFFSDGLTEEMISQVGKLDRGRLAVIARSSVAKFKGSRLPAKEIGKELNADYLVQGSVRRSSDRVRITVQFVQAGNQTVLWTESYERQLKDVLAVQDSVVRSIASQIHLALTEEQKARFVNPRQTQPDAYLAYLKGRYYWNKRTAESMQKAAGFFQQAIDSDPSYAGAYSGLADCNSGLSWHGFKSPAEALPKAYAAARKAIEINPESAEAHASLGLVHNHSWVG